LKGFEPFDVNFVMGIKLVTNFGMYCIRHQLQ